MSDAGELTPEDVREILRAIDEAGYDELELETPRFSIRWSRRRGTPRPGGPESRGEGAAAAAAAAPEEHEEQELLEVTAPMVGTFYRAPSPGAAPFVEVGSRVEPETQVCIVEVMKLMHSVAAGVGGVVAEVCRENGVPIQYGDVLFRIRPEAPA